MSAVNISTRKSPARRRGEKFLRDKNLLVTPKALSNTESAKYKVRAIRLKEEYQKKYLIKGKPQIVSPSSQDGTIVRAIAEGPTLVIEIDNSVSIYSIVKRTLSFCITVWLVFLAAIALCILVGYCLRFIYY